MSQPKATAETPAHSHIRMYTSKFLLKESLAGTGSRNKFSRSIPFILSVMVVLIAASCGSGTTNNTGSPIANAGGPYLGNANQSLTFNGSGSSAPSGRTLTSYAWLFGDGASGTGVTTSHTYTVAGNYTAKLTVTDSSGATNSSNVAVQIITAPVAKPGGPYSGKVGVAVSFNGSASTAPPGQALGFSWNFGDGSSLGTGATPTHTYAAVCTCTVSLTVTDDTAGTSTATTTATISAGPAPSGLPQTFFVIGPPANASSQFAYVLSKPQAGTSSLSIEMIDTSTGELRPADVTPPSLDTKFVPAGMITDPFRKFLYLYGGNAILSFLIDPTTGALTQWGSIPVSVSPESIGSQALAFAPSGEFAFFVTQDSGNADPAALGIIAQFSVDRNSGVLSPVNTISARVQNPKAALVEPSGKYLYVSGVSAEPLTDNWKSAAQIEVFLIEQKTGALTPTSDPRPEFDSGAAATQMAIDPTGRFLYTTGHSISDDWPLLSAFAINKDTGALTEADRPTVLEDAASFSVSLVLSPSGGLAYVFSIGVPDEHTITESVQVFHLDEQTGATATLSALTWDKPASISFRAIPTGTLAILSANQSDDGVTPSTAIRPNFVFLTDFAGPGVSVFSNRLDANSLAAITPSALPTKQ